MSNPFMQLYVGDYLKDTRHLTAEQHGAYLLLLMAMWNAEGSLPNDPKKLARIAACAPSRWAKIADEVMEFFSVGGDVITNARLSAELKKASEKSIKRAVSGTKGGKAKALKTKEAKLANATVLPEHSSEPEPEEENPPTPQGGRRKPKVSIPDGFPDQTLIAEQQAKARTAGANVDISNQAERFRNWSIGKDSRYADWPATWRNWCDRAIREAPRTAVASLAGRCLAGADDVWRRRVREYRSNRFWPTDDAGPAPGRPGCRVPTTVLAEFGIKPQTANDAPLFSQGAAA